MDKTENPTKAKLEELREAGRVAYSPLATKAIVGIGVFWWLLWQFSNFPAFHQRIVGLFPRVQSRDALSEGLALLFRDTVWFLLTLSGVGAVLVLLSGLLQTKFMFRMANISFNATRLNPFSDERREARRSRSFTVIIFLACLSAALLVVVSAPGIFQAMRAEAKDLPFALQQVLRLVGPALSVGLAVVAFFSWLGARQAFARRHRMTRREVQQDGGGAA